MGKYGSSNFSFFKNNFVYARTLALPYEFKINLSISTMKITGIKIGIALNL